MDLGLLQRQVAEILGVDETSVYQWERGATQPGVHCIPRIHDFLGYCAWRPTRTFGEWLRVRREALGMTQAEIAKAAGVDESSVAGWERGETQPTAASVAKVEGFFARKFAEIGAETAPRRR